MSCNALIERVINIVIRKHKAIKYYYIHEIDDYRLLFI